MPSLTVLRAAEGRRMPWKNGGGDTVEIAVAPADADFDRVDWRVSIASMTADGPFSAFAGLDRTLTVIDGGGIELTVGSTTPMRLEATSAPLPFPADVACTARLLAGPVTNLNVMTRRARFHHRVSRLDLRAPIVVAAEAVTLLVCCAGTLRVGDDELGRHDVLVSRGHDVLHVISRGRDGSGVLITVMPH